MSFNFGNTTAAAAKPVLNFGTPAATSAFGSVPTATVQPQSAPAFGSLATTTTATSSFGFGTPATTNPVSSVAPLNFGAGSTTAAVKPAFGAATTQATGSTAFGAKPTGFGAPQQPALGFGQTTQATGFGSLAPSSTPSLLTSGSSLTFGAPAASAGSTGGFGLGGTTTTATTTATPATGFGLGGTSFSATPAGQTSTAVTGLGGTASGGFGSQASASASAAADSKSGGPAKTIKETPIPNELMATVEEFKKFVKEERSISSDIAHVSPKIHDKISEEIEGMSRLVTGLVSGLSRNRAVLDKLKREAAQEILNAEIAQRTRDTPPGLQYENVAPYEYFGRLVANFEGQMLHYRRQIEETEHHLQTMASGHVLTTDDVNRALQKLHTAFVGLAGRYQAVHEAVKSQGEAFVQWHRHRYGTTVEVYAQRPGKGSAGNAVARHTPGPSPFVGGEQDLLAQAKAALAAQPAQQQQQQQQLQQPQPSGSLFSSNLGMGPPKLGLTSATATPFGQQLSSPFSSGQKSGFGFGNAGNTTAGLLGSTVSPFGSNATANNNQTSLFQSGGKRGKH